MTLDKFSYYFGLGLMLVRGCLYQLVRLQFRGWLLMGRHARVLGLHNLKLRGMAKLGHHAVIDARFCTGVILGDRFSLGDFSIMRASGSPSFRSTGIDIDDQVSFGPYANIGGGFGLKIGRDCVFGPYISVHPEGHNFSDPGTPIRLQGIHGKGIVIGPNNWFGAKCTILDDATIDAGCVFAAGSTVVSGHYPDGGLFAGTPARLKRRLHTP